MSQHIFETSNTQHLRVTVTIGYDRPLDYVFCIVMANNGDILYSNLDDESAGTIQQDVNYFRPVLARLGIRVPDSVFTEVTSDQRLRVGNRVVVHRVHAYDVWIKKYRPVKNHVDENASFEGTMFETFGPEVEFVASSDPKKIWTLVDSDGASLIEPGFHYVNRIGYFVTALPVEPDDENQTIDIEDEGTEE